LYLIFHSLVPWKSRGAALLALTGDVEFNKAIRVKAGNLGMHLNEFGLWRWQSSIGSVGASGVLDINENDSGELDAEDSIEQKGFWELIRADTEEDILAELDMEWVEPTKRNFSFVLGKQTKKKAPSKGKSRG
jgi:DNA polymerase beta